MSNVHQDFKASLDTKGYEAGMARIENSTKTSTARATREFDKMQQSASRRDSGRVGQFAMQAQDVAVQMQMGTSMSRILAQQGSQLASIFGSGGAVVGGLIAAGALIWENVHATQELAKKAKLVKDEEARIVRGKTGDQMVTDDRAAAHAQIQAEQGKEAADQAKRQWEYEEKINELRKARKNDLLTEQQFSARMSAAEDRRLAEDRLAMKTKNRDASAERVAKHGQGILDRADQIRGKGPSKAEVNREEREQRQAERRAINEELDKADREERNELQGTGRARTKGLTRGHGSEQEKGRQAREEAAKVAKDKKVQAEISQENIDKILNGIENLIAK